MKLSQTSWTTFKENPADAEIASHQLMIRAGLIHKSGAGIYNLMPFGLKVVRNIEKIIREELDKIGCQELLMTVITPGELWQKSGRWEAYGDDMLKMKDKGGRDLCVSPTNEETVTTIFQKNIKSYKNLPVTYYQINTKFRDEIRPRFGLMRGREFIMKDAYSFHMDWKCLDKTYEKIKQAYINIFERLGLKHVVVDADAGAMASSEQKTHEFQVVADSGEDQIVHSKNMAANIEKAFTFRKLSNVNKEISAVSEVSTPGKRTIEDVSKFLTKEKHTLIKSMVYFVVKSNETFPVMVCLLGDDELNEVQLKAFYKADRVLLATDEDLKKLGLIKGFIGPLNSNLSEIVFDNHVDESCSYTVGANKVDYHINNFNLKRDIANSKKHHLRLAKVGDLDQKGEPISITRGIEVGHIFQLGDKYTKSMEVKIPGEKGGLETPIMGCYGIGVTRLAAAVIEQSHDDKGIIWPESISPYKYHMIIIGRDSEFLSQATKVYESLSERNISIVLDDRDLGPGFKFKDADLLGCPYQLVMGERDFKESGKIKLVNRRSGHTSEVALTELSKVVN
jgi:prolyl-tRNA synthetase